MTRNTELKIANDKAVNDVVGLKIAKVCCCYKYGT